MFRYLLSAALAWACLITVSPAAPERPAADVRAELDAALRSDWARHQIEPLPPAGDATFLRRVWLDLAGATPPVDAPAGGR